MRRPRVLILCTGNSARSQMAEGLLRHDASDSFEVFSAGTRPTRVRPEAIVVMGEIGIDISGYRANSIDQFTDLEFDYVITVCDHARELCPIFPGDTRHLHWSLEDPAAANDSGEEHMAAYRKVRDELKERLKAFVAEHCHFSCATSG